MWGSINIGVAGGKGGSGGSPRLCAAGLWCARWLARPRLFAQGGQGEGLLLRGLQPSVTVTRIEQHESAKKERKMNGQPGWRFN